MSRRVPRRQAQKAPTFGRTVLNFVELCYRGFVSGDSLHFVFLAKEDLPHRDVGRPITFMCAEQGDREECPFTTASRWLLTLRVLKKDRKASIDSFYVVKRQKLPHLGKEEVTIQPCKITRNILRKELA